MNDELVVVGKTGVAGSNALDELYARHTKLVFLLDVSASMGNSFEGMQSRIDVVRRAVGDRLQQWLDRYPTSQVVAYTFDHRIQRRFEGREAAKLVSEALYPQGGTDIVEAVGRAVHECEKRPSGMGLHHVILVTDGQASADGVVMLLPQMKTLNIVLDFIWIARTGEVETVDVQQLREVCTATSGEFQKVDSIAAFQFAFEKAAERKCLPAAPGGAA